jgi:hypothetical protein
MEPLGWIQLMKNRDFTNNALRSGLFLERQQLLLALYSPTIAA